MLRPPLFRALVGEFLNGHPNETLGYTYLWPKVLTFTTALEAWLVESKPLTRPRNDCEVRASRNKIVTASRPRGINDRT